MKKQALTLALLICSWMAMAQTSYPPYDFKAANVDGDTLYYRVTSSSAPYTVAVTRCMDSVFHTLHVPHTAFDVGQPGYAYPLYNYDSLITIPSEVSNNGITYSVSAIDNEAFYFQWGIRKVILPTAVTTIDTAAFYLSSLSEIVMPGVQQILFGAFYSTPLEQVELPQTLTYMGNSVFAGTHLREVDIPSGVTELLGRTFLSAPLEHIIFHEGLEIIHDMAFSCNRIDTLIFPSTLQFLGKLSDYLAGSYTPSYALKYVKFKEGTLPLELGDYCMAYMDSLSELLLPDNVVEFGENCFLLSGLPSVTIPSRVTSIPQGCFQGCDSLKEIVVRNPIPLSLGLYAFPQTENIRVVIPCHSIENYENSPDWSNYENFSFVEDCVGVEETDKTMIRIWPIPVHNRMYVSSSNNPIHYIEMYDACGHRMFYMQSTDNQIIINTSKIPRGMYYLRLVDSKEYIHTFKVAKN